MNREEILILLPEGVRESARNSWNDAKSRKKGILWHKIVTRLWYSRDIAKLLAWKDNRLLDVKPEWADKDIELVKNITCNGDNIPWGDGGLDGNFWLNEDPNSEDYKQAVASCYWCKGEHPRSLKARKAWYLRNGGAAYVYRKGRPAPVLPIEYMGEQGRYSWSILNSAGTWHFRVHIKLIGNFGLKINKGFEVGNAWDINQGVQGWIPFDGQPLMAPVTWSTLPGKA